MASVAIGVICGADFDALIAFRGIVPLAALIPLARRWKPWGATVLIAGAIVAQTAGLPAWAVLAVPMVITMPLWRFINLAATARIAAPIGATVAQSIGVSPALLRMAVAASCAVLSPVGHTNNAVILRPGSALPGECRVLAGLTGGLATLPPGG